MTDPRRDDSLAEARMDELERLAKTALEDNWCDTPLCSVAPEPHPRQSGCPGTPQQWAHYRAVDPATVLALVAEVRALRQANLDFAARDGEMAIELRAARQLEQAVREAQLNPMNGPVRGWLPIQRALRAIDQATGVRT